MVERNIPSKLDVYLAVLNRSSNINQFGFCTGFAEFSKVAWGNRYGAGGGHGSNLRMALLTEGEFFGEADLMSDRPSDVTIRTITPCILLTLSSKDLDSVLSELPNLNDDFQRAIAQHQELSSTVNRYGERNIDLVSGFAENVEIPETFVDYSAHPHEYSLSAVQTVVRVHTRVSDLCNDPFNQLEEQMRLTIEGIKERQEWELINS